MRNNKRLKLALSTGLASIIMIVLGFMIYGVYSFFTTYGIQSPVLFQSPIYKLKNEVIISPIKGDKKQKSMLLDLGKIADKIYQLESSGGKNDGCRDLGLYNGYGYRQNSFEWICYNSHEEVRQHVINWLTKNIKNGDIRSALCLYNQGKVTNECTYAVNFERL